MSFSSIVTNEQDVNDRRNGVGVDEGVNENSLYLLLNFSVNLKVLKKIRSINFLKKHDLLKMRILKGKPITTVAKQRVMAKTKN